MDSHTLAANFPYFTSNARTHSSGHPNEWVDDPESDVQRHLSMQASNAKDALPTHGYAAAGDIPCGTVFSTAVCSSPPSGVAAKRFQLSPPCGAWCRTTLHHQFATTQPFSETSSAELRLVTPSASPLGRTPTAHTRPWW